MDTLLRVLFVEDSEDDALLILRELHKGGYKPEYQRVDNRDAMRLALSTKAWDIILSDYNMPLFSAFDALEILKESSLDIPFIIVSGAIGEEKAVQLMKEGANDYVMKNRIQRLVPLIRRELQEAEERKLRRNAEDNYRKSDFIVNASNDLMAIINRDYIFEVANKSFYKFFGKNESIDIVGSSAPDLCAQVGFQKALIKKDLDRCLRGEEIKSEQWLYMPDGSDQCFEITYSPYINSMDTSKHAVMVMHNITDRKMAEKELGKSYQKLQKTFDDTVHALSALVEMRDPYTSGHQIRVAKTAQAIAKELGLSENCEKAVWVSSLIHDIGKIRIPSDILTKPGKITKAEFELIKEHPQAGYEILKTIEFPWPVAEIVLQHHERIDGSGYPAGLKGSEIRLESKIIAVADVIEAMTFHRPYRESLGLEAALEEIRNNKGILYDPNVVDACIDIFIKKGFELK